METHFNEMEIATELGIPQDAVIDLLAGKMEIKKVDVDKLLASLVKKLSGCS